MHRRQVFDYVTMALLWGCSFVLVLRVVQAFGWAQAVALRCLVASTVLMLGALATRRRLRFGSWRPLLAVGATTAAGQLVGLNIATPRIGTAMAAIFVATIPLFSLAIGHLWGVEQVGTAARVGLALGFCGVVLLVGFPAVPVTGSFVVGCVASVAAAVAAALGSNIARLHLQDVGSWEQTIATFFFGGLLVLPLVPLVPAPHTPRVVDVAELVLLAALCSSLTYVLYFRLVAEAGATVAISVEFLVTVIAVTVGAVLLGEHISPVQLIGGAVIVLGCALVLGLVPLRSRVTVG